MQKVSLGPPPLCPLLVKLPLAIQAALAVLGVLGAQIAPTWKSLKPLEDVKPGPRKLKLVQQNSLL